MPPTPPGSGPSPSDAGPTPADAGSSRTGADLSREGRLDLAQLAALYVEHWLELRRFLRGVLRSEDLAEDALQSAFTKAIEVGHTASPETFKGWLFRVAMNEALAVRRRQTVHEQKLQEQAIEQRATLDRSPERRVERDSPAGGLIHAEKIATVRRAIARLSPEQRQVVQMRIDQDKAFATIAGELELPLGTVLSRMQAALKRLRNDLDDPRADD
jgi:RNA polymerase sigma-70 factor (ECF subfamily)